MSPGFPLGPVKWLPELLALSFQDGVQLGKERSTYLHVFVYQKGKPVLKPSHGLPSDALDPTGGHVALFLLTGPLLFSASEWEGGSAGGAACAAGTLTYTVIQSFQPPGEEGTVIVTRFIMRMP